MSGLNNPTQVTVDPLKGTGLEPLRAALATQGIMRSAVPQQSGAPFAQAPNPYSQLYTGPLAQSFMGNGPQQPGSIFSPQMLLGILGSLLTQPNPNPGTPGGYTPPTTGGYGTQGPPTGTQTTPTQTTPPGGGGSAPPPAPPIDNPPPPPANPPANPQADEFAWLPEMNQSGGPARGFEKVRRNLENAISLSGHGGAISPYMIYKAGVDAGFDPAYMAQNTIPLANSTWFADDANLISAAQRGQLQNDPYGNVGKINDTWKERFEKWRGGHSAAPITPPATNASSSQGSQVTSTGPTTFSNPVPAPVAIPSIAPEMARFIPQQSQPVLNDALTQVVQAIAASAPTVTSPSRTMFSMNDEINPQGIKRTKKRGEA